MRRDRTAIQSVSLQFIGCSPASADPWSTADGGLELTTEE